MMRATPVTAKPITQARLHQRVVEELLKQIVSGALPPGTALPSEPELARQFGVSRIVIREAIRILAEKGLVAVRHGSGMWIQPPEQWDHLDPQILFERLRSNRDPSWLEEILELRKILELAAAELAAQRRTPEQLAQLSEILERMRAALSDPSNYVNLDIAFHEAIMDAAGNRLLREARRPLSEVLFSSWLMTTRSAERLARTHEGHEEIYAAIAAGDPVAAREAMRRHIEHFEDNIRADLELPSHQAVTVGSNGHQSAR
ncbi:FadR/GntR family transcriptional regulator [Thermomicrobium sp. 4228-Ro]|uniref:FadR/GntR family transcriptional regulator n=1 Tax=Thermomicrobium sp. 4228-Ro TaxID=2993937 RepID=UPI0022497C87|nr:FadR/GntR family transcriptional regulator [Thermomicrobium sp. 4228-Ro]MCX2728154.1 FadR/GntR family transcriptional regulator [Thermomicrobium sp. 4228-Ro]